MSKTITTRLKDSDYDQIARAAEQEHRPISNFITHAVLDTIANVSLVDDVEMKEILSDAELMQRLKRGHANAAARKGKFVK
ncbi:MAG: CopG family transcriptional regulator [Candidatus Omnitrophica bacterium]|nr:CopG family transcriptional regulator [Candidatus Omnitrophota bacterium]